MLVLATLLQPASAGAQTPWPLDSAGSDQLARAIGAYFARYSVEPGVGEASTVWRRHARLVAANAVGIADIFGCSRAKRLGERVCEPDEAPTAAEARLLRTIAATARLPIVDADSLIAVRRASASDSAKVLECGPVGVIVARVLTLLAVEKAGDDIVFTWSVFSPFARAPCATGSIARTLAKRTASGYHVLASLEGAFR